MSLVNRLNATQKLIISAVISVLAYLATINFIHETLLHLLVSWDVFCLFFVLLNWITFFTILPQQIRNGARKQNEGRVVVFIIALIATLAALSAVLLLLLDKSQSYREVSFTLLCSFGGLILSWVLVHTIFTVRYAHLYYADHKEDNSKHAGGLEFPDGIHPDFLDFAYYSFVIGMTFQVSDVSISSRKLRRLTLLHSLMAFAFNTIIVALTVNVIAGLSK
jgi:uncharacterized membrane protein